VRSYERVIDAEMAQTLQWIAYPRCLLFFNGHALGCRRRLLIRALKQLSCDMDAERILGFCTKHLCGLDVDLAEVRSKRFSEHRSVAIHQAGGLFPSHR